MRIAITGVTGFIGRHLATRVLARGHEVTAFSRRPWTGAPYVPLDDRHFLDLPARPAPDTLAGVDAIVHLAIAAQSASDAVTDSVNRVGTEWLLEAAKECGVGRFIFLSSQSAHTGVDSAYGRSKHAVTQAFEGRPGFVIVRPGMVFGDADAGLVARAARTAAKLRVFPVIGGDAARVQPIDVQELCDALIALAEMSDPPPSVELGDPTAVPLGEFVRQVAQKHHGVSPRPINVSIGVARAAVRFGSRFHLPLPISEANIAGIESFEPMDTAADMATMRKVTADTLRPDLAPPRPVEPRKVILIGSGRVGLVHALTAAHHQRMVLAGIVDLDKAAMHRLAALAGPTLPMFTDLDEALRVVRPDAAIISTPPSSHVPLASKLLAAGVDVLVEKPLAATSDDRQALSEALARYPDRYLATGYFAGLLPHLAAIAGDLRAGRFGAPVSFDGHSFVSRIEEGVAEQRDMWELDPSISGGGALVNLGVHVLAMLDVLLGSVEATDAKLVTSGERRIEDGATVHLRAGGVAGRFTTAWHLPGFSMPENQLRIDTERGYVLCTTSCAAFVGDGEVHVIHQVDADAGFDLAPMDAGGAFWAEQDLLARRSPGANSLDVANRVEDLITDVYRTATRIGAPRADDAQLAPPASQSSDPNEPALTIPDLRGAPTGAVGAAGALVGALDERNVQAAIIALPDAPGHFRTLTNNGPVALARQLRITNLSRAALGVSPRRALSSGGRTWEALLVLMRAELGRIPASYAGMLVVDAYLVDLATATGNVAVIEAALVDLRGHCGGARVGVEVNATARLVPHIPALASQLDVVVALGTTRAEYLAPLRELLPDSAELVVKTGVMPRELLEIAWDDPQRWTHGSGRLVVHWPGSPELRAVHKTALARARQAAGLDPAVRRGEP